MTDRTSQHAGSRDSSSGNLERVYDLDVALARLGGSTDLFAKLVRIYFDDSRRLMDTLRHAAVHGDVVQVERAAHTLKSLAANFEAQAAARAALRVEEAAQAGNLGAAVERIPDLEMQMARLDRALASYADGSDS